jgi:large subunit ribosomal protein L24
LAIAVILALLAALFGPHFVDWNAQRGNFERQASALIGLPVRVGGKMDVRLLPSPSLVLSNIEIGKPGDAQALRAKALGIEFALPALLNGKLRAVELRVIAPELRLSLDRDGRAMLPQALAGLNTEALSIDKLMVEDARVEMSDAASDARLVLGKLWFNGEVRALPGPFRGEGAFVMDGGLYGYRISSARPEGAGARIKFSLDPSDRPIYAEAEGMLTAEGGVPRFDGNTTIARRNAVVKSDRAPPSDPWRITARVKASPASALFEQVEYQYGPDERALKLTGTAEAKFGAHPKLNAVLSARQLDADKLIATVDGHKPAPRAAIAALLSAAADSVLPPIPTQIGFGIDSVTLGGAVLQDLRGDLEIVQGGANLTGFELRAPGFTRLQAGGRIDFAADRTSFTGPVDLSSVDPRAFAEWLDGKANAAKLPAKPLRMRGEVTLAPGRIAIERMNAEYDRNAFDGSLSYAAAEAGKRARLEAKLRADDLDLDAWLAVFGASLSDLARPQDISLALTLALGRLRFAGLEVTKSDVALTLHSGALAIERFSVGDFGGAALDARGRIDLEKEPHGGMSFDLSLKDAAVLRTLAERFAPQWSDALQRSALAAIPAKLQGKLDIEPGAAGASRTVFAASGPFGSSKLDLTSSLNGQWSNARAADVALQLSLDAPDVNSLTGLLSADRIAPVAKEPGRYTLSLGGKPDGEMRIDTRLASASLDLRASGVVRSLASEERSGALDVVIGPSPATQPRFVLPGAPAGGTAIALKSALKFDPAGLRFDNMQASIGGTDVSGRLGIGFGKPTVIDGDLKAEAIDLPVLLAAATGLHAPGEKANWSETPFATSAWPSMIGAVTVSAARATMLPSILATKLRFGLRFTGHDVVAEAIEAELFGGRMSGEAALRRGGEGIGLSGRIALRDAAATQIMTAENSPPVTGRAGIQLQLEGAGLTLRALVGSLNGSGKVTLEKGVIAALDPKAFAAAIRSVDQGLPLDASRIRDVVMRALEAGPLVVHNAEAALSIAAGVVRIDSFSARTDIAELAATGSYNLADSGLDARVALRGPATAGVSQRPELAILLRGPALSPQRSLDVSALTGWLALRSVDQQTRRIEAIEQGRPAEAAVQTPQPEPDQSAPLPDIAPVLPRKRPVPHAAAPARADPLPPAVEVGPAPGIRPRVPQRVDGAPQRPVESQANPFPRPIGPPPQAPQPPPPAGARIQPIF